MTKARTVANFGAVTSDATELNLLEINDNIRDVCIPHSPDRFVDGCVGSMILI